MKHFEKLLPILPAASSVAALLVIAHAHAHAQELIELTNEDTPRSFLSEMAAKELEPATKGNGPKFKFPAHVQDSYTYGIDLSHHNFAGGKTIAWHELPAHKISFVYLKASQGVRFVDKTFVDNWNQLGKLQSGEKPVLRGAYHFLSADLPPDTQATNFLNQIGRVPFDAAVDLPPTLDLEWDLERDTDGKLKTDSKGRYIDRWKKFSPNEIVERAATWIAVVEKTIGVKPIIYTNAQWWKSVGLSNEPYFGDRTFWVSDYTVRANSSFSPGRPGDRPWTMWQFTENGSFGTSSADANIILRDLKGFKKLLGSSSSP
ncbi:glycoside hydrolase family 25 protein [Rhizobium laguerreae]